MSKHFTVDAYLADPDLPYWMKRRMENIRQLLLTFPEIEEKIRYTVPFYDYCGMLIYMGPYQKKRLVIGFCNGIQMKDPKGLLKHDAGQTQIRHYELFEHKDPDEIQIIRLIKEAIRVNKQLKNVHSNTRS